jgi:hypothetical protein
MSNNENKDGWPDKFHVVEWPIVLRKLGDAIISFVSLHQLASHGDNFVHPLDNALDAPAYILHDANLSGFGYDPEEAEC